MLETIEFYYDECCQGRIEQNTFDENLDWYARNHGYENKENLFKAFSNVVSFTNRTRIENYLEHGLELINSGTMFRIIANKNTGNLFSKIKTKGYRVDHYEIKVIKMH